jgi:hypothetical protein
MWRHGVQAIFLACYSAKNISHIQVLFGYLLFCKPNSKPPRPIIQSLWLANEKQGASFTSYLLQSSLAGAQLYFLSENMSTLIKNYKKNSCEGVLRLAFFLVTKWWNFIKKKHWFGLTFSWTFSHFNCCWFQKTNN